MNTRSRATPSRCPARSIVALAALVLVMPAGLTPTHAAERSRSGPVAPTSRATGIVASAMSLEARQLVDWIVLTGDHGGAPFIVVDKKRASVLVFEADARLLAQSAVLLGSALGDHSVPGIGTRPMDRILPSERTTPAGRFVAERGRNTQGEDVVWVDYDAAVSMHRVRTAHPAEQRAHRLATPDIGDNRISYGCINVPVAFFDHVIRPIFALRTAMVYVLPDARPVEEVFGIPHTATTRHGGDDAGPTLVQGVNRVSAQRITSRRR